MRATEKTSPGQVLGMLTSKNLEDKKALAKEIRKEGLKEREIKGRTCFKEEGGSTPSNA